MAAGSGVVFQAVDELRDLVDGFAIILGPRAPLLAVNRAEVAVFVGPFVPNADFILLEIADVGLAFEKPEELVNDRAEMQLLGGQAGEAFAEVVARLATKNTEGAGAGAVSTLFAVLKNIGEKVEISLHDRNEAQTRLAG